MKTKFTPGPWALCPYRPGDKKLWINGPAIQIDYDDVDHDEEMANAKLVAAAPELFEALRMVCDECDESVSSKTFKAACAALTKAGFVWKRS